MFSTYSLLPLNSPSTTLLFSFNKTALHYPITSKQSLPHLSFSPPLLPPRPLILVPPVRPRLPHWQYFFIHFAFRIFTLPISHFITRLWKQHPSPHCSLSFLWDPVGEGWSVWAENRNGKSSRKIWTIVVVSTSHCVWFPAPVNPRKDAIYLPHIHIIHHISWIVNLSRNPSFRFCDPLLIFKWRLFRNPIGSERRSMTELAVITLCKSRSSSGRAPLSKEKG